MKNFKNQLFIMAVLVITSSISFSAEFTKREYKSNCTKNIGGSVVLQKNQDKYTLTVSADFDTAESMKYLTLFGDSFAVHFENVNDKFYSLSPKDVTTLITGADEALVFTCPDFELRKRNYIKYDLDVDTYEIMVKQKYLRKSKRMSYF